MRVVIYCPPCLHLIATAEIIARAFSPGLYRSLIRIDGTIPVSCCSSPTVASNWRDLNDAFYTSEGTHRRFDTVWIESQIADYKENGAPPEFDLEGRCTSAKACAVIGHGVMVPTM